MIGLVIAAHGHLAEELVATAEEIAGKLERVATCSVSPSASPEEIRQAVRTALEAADEGEGVLVLADLFGGTPCNQALTFSREHSVEVLTGVNLPMVLKAASLRGEGLSLPELAQALIEYGQRNITWASALLREATQGTRPPH